MIDDIQEELREQLTAKEDGGPAFPVAGMMHGEKLGGQLSHGMTLRDYFAAKASDGDVGEIMSRHFDHDSDEYAITRQQARYIHADAMLAARKQ